MKAIVFENNENGYLQWIAANPEGYVLNSYRRISPKYMVLHRATCRTINEYLKNMAENAFTGGQYMKICSSNHADLSAWVNASGGNGFTKLCAKCYPPVSEPMADANIN